MPHIAAKRICLIRTSAIGDTVHALGLLNGLRKGYPDAHLTWVLQTIPYEMVQHQPGINQFITFNRKGGLKDWRELLGKLRAQSFDLAVVPQASAKVSLITLLVKAGIRLGFDFKRSREFHWLVTNRHIPSRPMGHVQDQFLEFLENLGITDYQAQWHFAFTSEELAWQQSYFNALGRPAAGFVIASAHPEKDWPADRYARTIDYVSRVLDLQPLLIGGPSEAERKLAAAVAEMSHCEPTLALEKPIRRTMLQLAGCRLLISPDTGPLHIAVALNVPTIGLYGYSNPKRCGPYRRFPDLLIDKYNDPGEENAPITRKTRPGRMRKISVAEVIEKIEYGLARYPSPDVDLQAL